jgi:hypothetical protein
MPDKQYASVCGSAMAADLSVIRVNSLVDTGAILALLDRMDCWHQLCVDAFQQLRRPLKPY